MKDNVYIIAEAGVNHNGSIDQAVKLINAAKTAKADAIKFQTFLTEACISKNAALASYQRKNIENPCENQFDMVKKLELSFSQFEELSKICSEQQIDFISTPFDFKSIEFLSNLKMQFWKIPSGEITNLPYLEKVGSLGRQVILSTGMADLGEIEDALDILENAGTPRKNITVLHCNTEYPTPMQDVNLRAMLTIQQSFPGIQVGYSDHTLGTEVPIAAVTMGATVIEKHFTLDKSLPGPDHKASLEPAELCDMIQSIRNIEMALGNGIKKPSPSETANLAVARKSIVAARPITAAEVFTEENLTAKRPGSGVSPMRWYEMLGKKSNRAYAEDELIDA
jgi:N,N'-diacetyllegionaminate synthase